MINKQYHLDSEGRFVIEDYNRSKVFASFFPGIAGEMGIPIWGFYVNRGQCMAGFGLQDKDGAIQEFVPADKAPWYAMSRGFRTFIYPEGGDLYEPFRLSNDEQYKAKTRMTISPSDLEILENNPSAGMEVTVSYCTLPQESIGGLLRRTKITNLNEHTVKLRVVDGLAILIPAGCNNDLIKNMGATLRAWMTVSQKTGVPFYKLRFKPDDVPELLRFSQGNFFVGYTVSEGKVQHLPSIIDPTVVFGEGTDFLPRCQRDFTYPESQHGDNNLPSAMSYFEGEIKPGQSIELYGLYGQVPEEDCLGELIPRIDADYFERHLSMNRHLIREIQDYAFVSTEHNVFDHYIRQCFLDNVIRGGLPVTLAKGDKTKPKVFWLYSRKHGDLERDYNAFRLSPTYYSQGNGNFRDINQNRRNDVWMNPDVGDSVLRYFWNLIQLDGYNPLGVQGLQYVVEDTSSLELMLEMIPEQQRQELRALVMQAFTPGELVLYLKRSCCFDQNSQGNIGASGAQMDYKENNTEFVAESRPDNLVSRVFDTIMQNAQEIESAIPGEGFWIDHWTYNLDLIDSFLSIYPDKLEEVFFERNDYTFYDNWARIVPSDMRYYLVDGEIRQKNCYIEDLDKKAMIKKRESYPFLVRTEQGKGRVYRTNLIVKMLTLAVNKIASFDPFVTGLEMDASRPGWCDAINGMPSLLGSSVCEVFALIRLCRQLERLLSLTPKSRQFKLPVEVGIFMRAIGDLIDELPKKQAQMYQFWETTHQVRDIYLNSVAAGLDGEEEEWNAAKIIEFIKKAGRLAQDAVQRAYQPETGLYNTYYYHQVGRWRVLKENSGSEDSGQVRVWPEEFRQCKIPNFLEGQVHALRSVFDTEKAEEIYAAVRRSDLFDPKLAMYKVCADLTQAPYEIGRSRVFPRGWLENESVFLHMEYKYLLELLRSGLESKFYNELKNLLVCFSDPEVYGRNPLENCSFIVTSGNPQLDLHGRGFVARLSGSTAEMIHIWLLMSFGAAPFWIDDEQLVLAFKPILSAELFSGEERQVELTTLDGNYRSYFLPAQTYAASFLGRTLVVYHNPKRKPTFGSDAARIGRIQLTADNAQLHHIEGELIPGIWAEKVRQGKIERIDLYLA